MIYISLYANLWNASRFFTLNVLSSYWRKVDIYTAMLDLLKTLLNTQFLYSLRSKEENIDKRDKSVYLGTFEPKFVFNRRQYESRCKIFLSLRQCEPDLWRTNRFLTLYFFINILQGSVMHFLYHSRYHPQTRDTPLPSDAPLFLSLQRGT